MKEANCSNFAVTIEPEHILIIPQRNYDPSSSQINSSYNLNNKEFKSPKKENLTGNYPNSIELDEPVGCCSWFTSLFSSKKKKKT